MKSISLITSIMIMICSIGVQAQIIVSHPFKKRSISIEARLDQMEVSLNLSRLKVGEIKDTEVKSHFSNEIYIIQTKIHERNEELAKLFEEFKEGNETPIIESKITILANQTAHLHDNIDQIGSRIRMYCREEKIIERFIDERLNLPHSLIEQLDNLGYYVEVLCTEFPLSTSICTFRYDNFNREITKLFEVLDDFLQERGYMSDAYKLYQLPPYLISKKTLPNDEGEYEILLWLERHFHQPEDFIILHSNFTFYRKQMDENSYSMKPVNSLDGLSLREIKHLKSELIKSVSKPVNSKVISRDNEKK